MNVTDLLSTGSTHTQSMPPRDEFIQQQSNGFPGSPPVLPPSGISGVRFPSQLLHVLPHNYAVNVGSLGSFGPQPGTFEYSPQTYDGEVPYDARRLSVSSHATYEALAPPMQAQTWLPGDEGIPLPPTREITWDYDKKGIPTSRPRNAEGPALAASAGGSSAGTAKRQSKAKAAAERRIQNLTDPKPCFCGELAELCKTQPIHFCSLCNSAFHQACIVAFRTWKPEFIPLLGDDFFHLECRRCTRGKEKIKRLSITWVDVTHIALLNLAQTLPPRNTCANGLKYYAWKADICQFIDQHWDQFWIKARTPTWENTVASCLSTQERFVAGPKEFGSDQGLWALENEAPPSSYEHGNRHMTPVASISRDGTLQDRTKGKRKRLESDNEDGDKGPGDGNTKNKTETKAKRSRANSKSDISAIATSQTPDIDEEHATEAATKPRIPRAKPRRKSKKKIPIEEPIDPATAIEIYPDIDADIASNVQMSKDTTHRAPQITVGDSGLTVHTDGGYRMAKATHGVWEGKWYYEVMLNDHVGHTRIGWSQISGDLQAPCGYDQFSYGFRDSPGTLFHRKKKSTTPESYHGGYGPGDIVGISIELPPSGNMDDLLRRLWVRKEPYLPFRSRPIPSTSPSEIVFYKNGVSLGVAFKDLLRGKYHPAISSYRGGSATVNFGPQFRYPPPPGYRPMSDAAELPRWADIEAGIVSYDGETWDVESKDAAPEEEQAATPTPSSDTDAEEQEDHEDRDEAKSASESPDSDERFPQDFKEEPPKPPSPEIAQMDPDEMSGIQALLSLGGSGFLGDALPPDIGPTTTIPLTFSNPQSRQSSDLMLEIDAKEAEVLDLIRRSSADASMFARSPTDLDVASPMDIDPPMQAERQQVGIPVDLHTTLLPMISNLPSHLPELHTHPNVETPALTDSNDVTSAERDSVDHLQENSLPPTGQQDATPSTSATAPNSSVQPENPAVNTPLNDDNSVPAFQVSPTRVIDTQTSLLKASTSDLSVTGILEPEIESRETESTDPASPEATA
ncbi:Set1/Ash2 histone methyltransferase complex subunit ASH2 [Thoreauomyces humboldtii]|nr:Set1/Ash2 histone methyltransferase complex subunit ASH2 [Thoreauomyces humboldtii]